MSENDYNPAPLLYGHIEAAIAAVLDVKEENLKALRARLRHLRNIGVPKIERPGSGKKVEYSRLNALEMLICVELERGGYTPRAAAMVGPEIAAESYRSLYPFDDDEVYALVLPAEADRPRWLYAKGSSELLKAMQRAPASGFFVKASTLARKLERKFDETAAVSAFGEGVARRRNPRRGRTSRRGSAQGVQALGGPHGHGYDGERASLDPDGALRLCG